MLHVAWGSLGFITTILKGKPPCSFTPSLVGCSSTAAGNTPFSPAAPSDPTWSIGVEGYPGPTVDCNQFILQVHAEHSPRTPGIEESHWISIMFVLFLLYSWRHGLWNYVKTVMVARNWPKSAMDHQKSVWHTFLINFGIRNGTWITVLGTWKTVNRSDYVQITFNYVQIAFNYVRLVQKLWKYYVKKSIFFRYFWEPPSFH